MRKMIKGWRRQHWGDLAVLRYGRALRTHQDARAGYPVFGTNGPIGRHSEPLFPPGVIVGRKGAYRGIHYSRQGCWIIDTAFYLDIQDPQVDSRWAYYQLKTVDLNAIDSGSAIPSTTRPAFAAIPVSVPPLATQKSVVAVLDVLDDLVENNRRRVELLEQMAQAIYREWFVHFRYPGHENVPLVDSHVGPIPEGWTPINLFEVADVAFGFSFKSKRFTETGPLPVVRIRDVLSGSTETFTDEAAPERYRVLDGDVLIGMDGDFHLHQWAGGDAWLNQRVARLRPGKGLSARHLMLALKDPIQQWNAAISGTTVAHLGKRHLEQIELLMPPPALLAEASEILSDAAEQVRALTQSNRRLSTIRDLLLPKLVTGQIDVSELDLDALMDSVA